MMQAVAAHDIGASLQQSPSGLTRRDVTASRGLKQVSDQRPLCVGQATGIALLRQLTSMRLGAALRFTGAGGWKLPLARSFTRTIPTSFSAFAKVSG